MSDHPFIVVVCGPTGIGKSALAERLALDLNGVVVSADSVQVYRGFDIGSAKPTAEERARVSYRLVDARDPVDEWSAAEFVADADVAIAEIVAEGRLPIVCGGTGLYLRSLLHGLAAAAPSDPVLRTELNLAALERGAMALHAELRTVDPRSAERIHPNDAIRIVRALEILRLTGRPASDWRDEHALAEERYRWIGVALTARRPWIHRAIERRCSTMVRAGLVDEVRGLLDRGVPSSAPGFAAIGYREALQVVTGSLPEVRLEAALAASTRQYARRQLVWFRKQLRGLRWFDAERIDAAYPGLRSAIVDARGGLSFSVGSAEEHDVSGGDL